MKTHTTKAQSTAAAVIAAAAAMALNPKTKDREAASGMSDGEVIDKMPALVKETQFTINGAGERVLAKNHHAALMATVRSLMGLDIAKPVPPKVYECLKRSLSAFNAVGIAEFHADAIAKRQTETIRPLASGIDGDGTPALLGVRRTETLHRKTPKQEMDEAKAAVLKIRNDANALVEKSFEPKADMLKLASRAAALRKNLHKFAPWVGEQTLTFGGPLGRHMAAADKAALVAMEAAKATGQTEQPLPVVSTSGLSTSGKVRAGKGQSHSVAKLGKRDSAKVKAAILGDRKAAIEKAKRALAMAKAAAK